MIPFVLSQAVLEGKWPSSISKGRLLWRKLRNVIIGVAKFRKAIRRRSLSVYSNSGSEYDQISHASFDSFLEDEKSDTKHESIMKSDGDHQACRVGKMVKGTDEVESTGKYWPQSLWSMFIDASPTSLDRFNPLLYLIIDGAFSIYGSHPLSWIYECALSFGYTACISSTELRLWMRPFLSAALIACTYSWHAHYPLEHHQYLGIICFCLH